MRVIRCQMRLPCHLIFLTNLRGRSCYHLHFTAEENEAKRGERRAQRGRSQGTCVPGSEPHFPLPPLVALEIQITTLANVS